MHRNLVLAAAVKAKGFTEQMLTGGQWREH
jgi:hypothetical protein